MLRILTDRGTEYCGKVEHHDYQLYLAINDIEHTKTKAMSPQTNCICERFHKTILNEFIKLHLGKSSMIHLRNYKRIWTNGWFIIIMNELIKEKYVVVEHHLKH